MRLLGVLKGLGHFLSSIFSLTKVFKIPNFAQIISKFCIYIKYQKAVNILYIILYVYISGHIDR